MENIIVRISTMKEGHGSSGVTDGEISGNVRNVFIENCRVNSPNLDRALRFKSNALRGVPENVIIRNVQAGRVAEAALTIDFLYNTGERNMHKPVLRNVVSENVTSASSPRVRWAVGLPGVVIDNNVRFVNCTFRGDEAAEVLNYAGSPSPSRTPPSSLRREGAASTRRRLHGRSSR